MLATSKRRMLHTFHPKARSSVAERCHYMAEVGGSTPSAPTDLMGFEGFDR